MSSQDSTPDANSTEQTKTKDGTQSTESADPTAETLCQNSATLNQSECSITEKKDNSGENMEPRLKRDYSVPVMSVEEKRSFYRTIFTPCGELSQELKDKAKTELNETDETRSAKLTELRNMFQSEGDTGKGDPVSKYFREKDDKYLLRFLRTKKFDVKKTFEMMTAYVIFRLKYNNITEQLTFDGVSPALGKSLPGILPHKDKEGRVVMVYDTGCWDPKEVPFDEMLASFLFLLENLVENEENQIRGIVFLETYEKYHITQALQMKSSDIKKLADMLQGAFPGRFKGFHVIRQPWYFSLLMTLAKPFMGSKMASRIFVHGFNLKRLYDWIGPEFLPENFGGIGEEYDPQPLLDELKESLLNRGELRFQEV